MKILKFEAENIKRVKVVHIQPDGNTVVIRGNNAQGKSSVLDSIVFALEGKKSHPKRLIREGAERARVMIETEEFIVERTWTDDDKSKLEVRGKDGTKYSSPQKLMDDLVGSLSFDPLAFLRIKPKEQLDTLRAVLGLDFTDMDDARQALYDKRTVVNRDARRIKDALPPVDPDAPDELVDVTELLDQLSGREGARRSHEGHLRTLSNTRHTLQEHRDRLSKLEVHADELRRSIEELETTSTEQQELITEAGEPSDTAPIKEKIEAANVLNGKHAAAARWREDNERLEEVETESSFLTIKIESIDDEKKVLIEAATFPVEGLAFNDEDGILYNDLPFENASQSEQIKVAVAMGIALNPKLKVLLIREASLLDEESLAMIAEMAEKAGSQIWLEVVGKNGVGIVIEDGQVETQ